ncbi:MAG: tyrosine-type recombinase/integrase [Actinomycetota bacterium]
MARRGEGTGPWKRTDGRWSAKYTDARGKRRYLYGATKAEVQRKLRKALEDRDGGVASTNVTVGEWLDRWEASLRPSDSRETTRDDYAYRLSLIPGWVRARQLAELDPLDVEDMLAELLAAGGKRGQGLAPSNVAKVRSLLAQALSQAQRYGLVARNVAALTQPVREVRSEVEPLTMAEAKRLLAQLSGHRLESLYLVAVTTGMRESELVGLRWDDVDLDAGVVWIRRQRTRTNRGTIVEGDTKSPSSRRKVVLADVAAEALRRWRPRLAAERLELGEVWEDHGLVWPSTVGTPLHHRNLLRHLHRTCEKASVRRVSFHTLRHSAGTLMLAAGVDSRVVMDVLGHTDPRMMTRYQHVVDDVRHDAAAAVNRAWGGGADPEGVSERVSDEGPRTGEVPNPGS